jgi:hypothetical protein
MGFHVDILDAKCYLKGLNPYGEVDGGYLRIQGPLLQGMIRDKEGKPYIYHIEAPEHKHFFRPDDPFANTSRNLDDGPVFCLRWSISSAFNIAGDIWALILSPLEDADRPAFLQDVASSSQVYRRIGIADSYAPKWFEHEVEREIIIV